MSIQEDKLTEIADAIRAKEGSTDPIPANEFASRIANLGFDTVTFHYDASTSFNVIGQEPEACECFIERVITAPTPITICGQTFSSYETLMNTASECYVATNWSMSGNANGIPTPEIKYAMGSFRVHCYLMAGEYINQETFPAFDIVVLAKL